MRLVVVGHTVGGALAIGRVGRWRCAFKVLHIGGRVGAQVAHAVRRRVLHKGARSRSTLACTCPHRRHRPRNPTTNHHHHRPPNPPRRRCRRQSLHASSSNVWYSPNRARARGPSCGCPTRPPRSLARALLTLAPRNGPTGKCQSPEDCRATASPTRCGIYPAARVLCLHLQDGVEEPRLVRGGGDVEVAAVAMELPRRWTMSTCIKYGRRSRLRKSSCLSIRFRSAPSGIARRWWRT